MAQTLYYNKSTKQLMLGNCIDGNTECVYVAPTVDVDSFCITHDGYLAIKVGDKYEELHDESGNTAPMLIGPKGDGIDSISKTAGTGQPGTTDVYSVYSNGSVIGTFDVYNGAAGPKGSSFIATQNLVDQDFEVNGQIVAATYNMNPGDYTLSVDTNTVWILDNDRMNFTRAGILKGDQGPQGLGISSVKLKYTHSNINTYSVYVDQTEIGTFEVRNGETPIFTIINGDLYSSRAGDNPQLLGHVEGAAGVKGFTILGTIDELNELVMKSAEHNDAYILKQDDRNVDTGLTTPAGTLLIYDSTKGIWVPTYCMKGDPGKNGADGVNGVDGADGSKFLIPTEADTDASIGKNDGSCSFDTTSINPGDYTISWDTQTVWAVDSDKNFVQLFTLKGDQGDSWFDAETAAKLQQIADEYNDHIDTVQMLHDESTANAATIAKCKAFMEAYPDIDLMDLVDQYIAMKEILDKIDLNGLLVAYPKEPLEE